MRYNIRGENIYITEALKEYVEKKVSRIEKYFDTPPTSDINVTLKVVKGVHIVEVTIPMQGLLVRAEEANEDMYAAIDLVSAKLERQIRRHKNKINKQHRQRGGLSNLFVEEARNSLERDIEAEEDIQVVRTKKFFIKPMDVEEAVMQMDMLGHSFFVFGNMETEEMNVVYKRKDGKYCLIEPEVF